MKKMLAWLLALTLSVCLALPAAAAEVPAGGFDQGYEDGKRDKAAGKEPAWTDEDGDYIRGYSYGYATDDYELGYEDGEAAGDADAAAGKAAQTFPEPETDYDRGYQEGYQYGYEMEEFYRGYRDGLDAGTADEAAGKEEQKFSAPETNYDEGYQEGYQVGYTYGPYYRGYDDGLAAGQADRDAGREAQELPSAEDLDYDGGYHAGYLDGYYSDDEGEHIDRTLVECGGTPGKINVRLNEKCIDFGAVWPENRDGRTMAPVRAILEALGAQVTYDTASKTVTAQVEDKLLQHTIGTKFIEVYPDGDLSGEPQHLEMDCASYVSGGRTMVPVRFFSEALGYYVDWDSYYKTVVLLDTKGLIAAYDDQLTVLRLLLSDAQRPEGTYRQVAELSAGLDILDSLNGDTHLDLGGKVEGLISSQAANVTVDLDLGDLLDLYVEYEDIEDYLESYEKELLELCKKLHLELIYNRETGKLYVNTPIVEHLTGQDTWITADYGTQLLETADPLEQYMMQDILAEYDWYYQDPITAYDVAKERMDELVLIIGDQNFRKSGNTYTYEPVLQDAVTGPIRDELTGRFYDVSVPEINFRMQVTDNGDGTCNYTASLYTRAEDGELTADLRKTGDQQTLNASLHLRNELKLTAKLTTKTTPSNDPVRTTPPTEPVNLEDIYV